MCAHGRSKSDSEMHAPPADKEKKGTYIHVLRVCVLLFEPTCEGVSCPL
jgi:hypothetical protein